MESDYRSRTMPAAQHTVRMPGRTAHSLRRVAALFALLLIPSVCVAHILSVTECAQGSDFIRNAALARDGGMPEERFIGQMREDFIAIRACLGKTAAAPASGL